MNSQRPSASARVAVTMVEAAVEADMAAAATEEVVEDYRRASGSPATRFLAAEYDGSSAFIYFGMQSVEDLLELREPIRDTDVGMLFLRTRSGGSMGYPTSVGEMDGAQEDIFLTGQTRRRVETLRGYVSPGMDPVRAQVEHV